MTLALSLAALLRPSQLGLALPADSGPRPPPGPPCCSSESSCSPRSWGWWSCGGAVAGRADTLGLRDERACRAEGTMPSVMPARHDARHARAVASARDH